jgi:hypothetical protein
MRSGGTVIGAISLYRSRPGSLGISIADALAVLRSYAFATESQLREVARSVVNRTLDLSGR